MNIEIINGEAFEKIDTTVLDSEIIRREDELVRIDEMRITLQAELDALKVKQGQIVVKLEK